MSKTAARKKKPKVVELEETIEAFGDAMRSANLRYIAEFGRFTPGMTVAWDRYVIFCINNAS